MSIGHDARAADARRRLSTARAVDVHRVREQCRACGERRLRRFLSLGPTPLANAFPRSPDEFDGERSFPLDVYFCEECSLVQLADVIDPEVLFGEYIYVTGTSETIAAHNLGHARSVVEVLGLGPGDLVVEVASNDGSLLAEFRRQGVRTLGVEPARNIAEIARARGIETVCRFFSGAEARPLREQYGQAAAVIGNNVLAHVDDTQDFLTGCRDLLAPDGRVVVEVPYARDMVERLEYDTIYHEHLCYFTVSSLARLGEAVGLVITRVDRVAVHGGSIRVWFAAAERAGSATADTLAVQRLIEEERSLGLAELATYEKFARGAERNREEVRALLDSLRAEGKTIAAYGAPAKGNTLLNYCGLGPRELPFTVDKNPMKVGRYTPGAHIPVLPPEALIERQPDYVLILAWNFADEIIRQQQTYRDRGGKFIVPIPAPRVI